ncbi:TetR/AcrR family transcriptional regulator [Plantibacter sp. M259]|uniref:TetR/AcrR family transcriptional regulator n=1 Tax=Plantibacter sp. M259 TaxID=2583822 RepID=UPI001110B2A3|nr:TetR/AcrR family transcriptional regulator [Plantibacter sp. M259]
MMTTKRALRTDAERNRRTIISAAGPLFSADGADVSLKQVAASAGVGVGTIYRHFPGIDDLIAVVYEKKMQHWADEAERAADLAQTEPWQAFSGYVMFLLEGQANDIAFSDVLLSPNLGSSLFALENRRGVRATRLLVERAQQAGVIRSDFDVSDLFLLGHGNAGIVRGGRLYAPTAWRRFGQYMLLAFRTPGEDLEPASPSWPRDTTTGVAH